MVNAYISIHTRDILKRKQNNRRFAENIFECIYFVFILYLFSCFILFYSVILKSVPQGSIDNKLLCCILNTKKRLIYLISG